MRERVDGRWALPGRLRRHRRQPVRGRGPRSRRGGRRGGAGRAPGRRLRYAAAAGLPAASVPHPQARLRGTARGPEGRPARGQRGDRRRASFRSRRCRSSRSAGPCRSTCARRCGSRAIPPHCHTSTDGGSRSPRPRRLRAQRLPLADLGGLAPTRSGVAPPPRRGRRVLGGRAPRGARRRVAPAARLRLRDPPQHAAAPRRARQRRGDPARDDHHHGPAAPRAVPRADQPPLHPARALGLRAARSRSCRARSSSAPSSASATARSSTSSTRSRRACRWP